MSIKQGLFFVLLISAIMGCANNRGGLTDEDEYSNSGNGMPFLTDPSVDSGELKAIDGYVLPQKIPEQMKGYDLYSWEVEDKWFFTLISGTNRLKTEEEIITDETTLSDDGYIKVTVIGERIIISLLARLPEESNISWCTSGSPQIEETTLFTLPDASTVKYIKDFCLEHNLILNLP